MRKMWPSKQPPATFDHVSQVEQELRARVGDGVGIRDGDGLVVHLAVLHFCASGRANGRRFAWKVTAHPSQMTHIIIV